MLCCNIRFLSHVHGYPNKPDRDSSMQLHDLDLFLNIPDNALLLPHVAPIDLMCLHSYNNNALDLIRIL